MWAGDRCDYVPFLQEKLFPYDWEGQSRVLRLIYAEALPLTYQPETDLARIRFHLAQALGKNKHENDSKQ
jgi:hypothetical protein